MVTSAMWSFIFLGSASSRMRCWCFEIFRDTTIVIVLGEKYGAEWGKGISIPTTCRIWDLDVDEPIVLFPFSRVDRCAFMDCLVEQAGYRKCREGRSKVL